MTVFSPIRSPRVRLTLLFAVAAAVAAGVASVWHSHHLTALGAAFAACTAVVGLLPGALFAIENPRPPFPLIAFAGLFYAVFFGIAPLAADLAWPPPMPVVMYVLPPFDLLSTAAAGWALAGLLLMLSGFGLGRKLAWAGFRPIKLPEPPSEMRVRILAWAALAAHLAYVAFPAVRTLPSVGQLLDPLGYFAYGTLLVLYLEEKLPRIEIAAAAILLTLEAILIILGTLLTPLALLLLFLATIRFRATRRVPWLALAIASVVALVGYNVSTYYRLALSGSGPGSNRIDILTQAISHFAYGGDQPFFNPPTVANSISEQLSPALRRVNLLVPFTVVVEKTPGQVEYWAGQTYKNLLTSYIPRALWPDKPTETLGGEFGRRYGIIEPERRDMSVNLPWIVELYANFGAFGVLLGMFAIGLVLSLLDRLFNDPTMTPLEGVFGATIIFRLFYQESNLSLMTGSLLPLALALWVYLKVGFSFPERRSRPS